MGTDARVCKRCREEIHRKATVCPHCRKKQGWTLGAKLGLGFLCLFILLLFIDSSLDAEKKSDVLDAVDLDFSRSESAFGILMTATFTVSNRSKHDIKDIEIKCVHLAPSGTKVDSNKRTIYEIVKAGSARTFPEFDMGFIFHPQVESTRCGIQDIAFP